MNDVQPSLSPKEVVQACYEAMAARDFDRLFALVDPEVVITQDPALPWGGRHVGHVFLVKHPSQAHTAKLRLLFVEPSARGTGLGHALVNECVRFARTAGYRKIVLWTQSMLTAAHRIYQGAGFRLVKEEPHHSFGHDLVGQEWELNLS